MNLNRLLIDFINGSFTFNPFGVEAFLILPSPGCTWGYSHPYGVGTLISYQQNPL